MEGYWYCVGEEYGMELRLEIGIEIEIVNCGRKSPIYCIVCLFVWYCYMGRLMVCRVVCEIVTCASIVVVLLCRY